MNSFLEKIKQEEEKVREELSKEVEAKEEKNLAEGKLEIDDPLEIEKTEEEKEITNVNENAEEIELPTVNNKEKIITHSKENKDKHNQKRLKFYIS